MGLIGGRLGLHLLNKLRPAGHACLEGDGYAGVSKLETLLGPNVWDAVRGKTVIDFGCGIGTESVEMAQRGATRVIGLDIQQHHLAAARAKAEAASLADRCVFAETTDAKADVILSLDSFEHFDDPALILRIMDGLLADDGRVLVSFGPPWLHPYGSHAFSVFPWSHLVFREDALLAWKRQFTDVPLNRFADWPGGLNRMTIARFARLVEASPFRFEMFHPVPIRKLRPFHNRLTREFFSSIVRATLAKKSAPSAQ